ncbi:hypothetical protein IA69_08910 [Massilia sp. JS1662]|nr:hypothetical protein IA69_08910 [Massilia sp. JS1662]
MPPQAASRGGAMKSLVDGINSGDLTSAKAAFDTLQKNRQGATNASGTSSQRDQDIAAIGKALDSGDADAAKQALAKLRDDRKDANGGAQETHHHRSHRTQASGDSSLTYSASATTAPTAAPGSTIDVSA